MHFDGVGEHLHTVLRVQDQRKDYPQYVQQPVPTLSDLTMIVSYFFVVAKGARHDEIARPGRPW